MKRIILILTGVFLICSALAFADGGGKEEEISITFWHHEPPAHRVKAFQTVIDNFMKENPNVQVTQEVVTWDDAWPRQTDEPPEYNGDVIESPNTSEMKRFCINRHDGFVNGGLVDFSVRRIGLKELWKLKWHRGYRTNDPTPVWPDWMRRFRDY